MVISHPYHHKFSRDDQGRGTSIMYKNREKIQELRIISPVWKSWILFLCHGTLAMWTWISKFLKDQLFIFHIWLLKEFNIWGFKNIVTSFQIFVESNNPSLFQWVYLCYFQLWIVAYSLVTIKCYQNETKQTCLRRNWESL